MENASKALMIAGGVLLALMIITLCLYMANHIKTIKEANEQQEKTAQLQKFNQEYETYNKKIMYGSDVISVINKIADNNERYKDNLLYQIKYEGPEKETIEKTAFYKCSEIKYNEKTGRVNYMKFETHENNNSI